MEGMSKTELQVLLKYHLQQAAELQSLLGVVVAEKKPAKPKHNPQKPLSEADRQKLRANFLKKYPKQR